jgi:hypothetical protein
LRGTPTSLACGMHPFCMLRVLGLVFGACASYIDPETTPRSLDMRTTIYGRIHAALEDADHVAV